MTEISTSELALISDAFILDVREIDEYQSGHVPGAINIPLSELQERASEAAIGDVVYVVCQAGGRSARACQFLTDLDELRATTFVNVAGGTGAWIADGHEVVAGDSPR